MATFTGGFSARPHTLVLDMWESSVDYGANHSVVSWSLRIDKHPGWSTHSFNTSSWSLVIGGQAAGGTFTYDFRSSSSKALGSGAFGFYHSPDGSLTVGASASCSADGSGGATAGGPLGLTFIPKPPAAPTAVRIDAIGPTSMRFVFSGNGNGGAAVDQWQAQYSTTPGFATGVTFPSNGSTPASGLTPGTDYYFRARGHNSAGWGQWSGTLSARTLSGGYISDGTSWRPVEIFVGDGTSWKPALVQIGTGTTWNPAG